jgi:16S rRNA processing protein RimM
MRDMFIQIGQIINTHGIKGEVKVMPFTDDPGRFEALDWLYIKKNNNLNKYFITSIKYQKDKLIIRFKNVDSMSDAENLKNCMLFIDRDKAIKLPEDTYFIVDLIGLTVITDKGIILGTVDDIIATGSNDVYIVKDKEGREVLIPAIKDVVKNIDLNTKFITIIPLEGLMD